MSFLLIGKSRTLRQTRWLTASHYAAARRGDLVIVNMHTGERYGPGDWRAIPPRRGEPLVMMVPTHVEADEDGF